MSSMTDTEILDWLEQEVWITERCTVSLLNGVWKIGTYQRQHTAPTLREAVKKAAEEDS